MKPLTKISFFMFLLSSHTFSEPKIMSAQVNLLSMLNGDFGLNLHFKSFPHMAISVPISFYSLNHSFLLNNLLNAEKDQEKRKDIKKIFNSITMSHFKAGLGMRFSTNENALASGFYVEPIIYLGLLTTSDFKGIQAKDEDALAYLIENRKLKTNSYLAFTPELKLGYLWALDFGLLFNFGIFAHHVFTKETNSLFSIAKKYEQKEARRNANIAQFFTKMEGFHAGLFLNVGWNF